MGKPRLFTTLPVGMIDDSRPTALDIRCAMAIALRDGMSKMKGKGGGCYARYTTLAADAGTDVTNFSKSVSRLCKWGYVSREPQEIDRRRYTLRMRYPEPQKVGEATNDQDADKVGEPTSNQPKTVGEDTYESPEIVGEDAHENGGISSETHRHYSSLREELDFDESRELNSTKWRGDDHRERSLRYEADTQADNERDGEAELETPEGGLSRISFWQHLPNNIESLSLPAQVARIERAYDAIGRDADSIDPSERSRLSAWLFDISDTCMGGDMDATGQQANRLYEEVAVC